MTENAKEQVDPAVGRAIAQQVADLLESTVEIVTEYRCTHHPDRTATAVCEGCGADLCSTCGSISGHRLLCTKCIGSLDRAFAGIGPASLVTRLLTHPLLVVLVLIALLGGLFVSLGKSHRKGLLGTTPESALDAEKQFRLKILLYTQKADRIETRADSLHDAGRLLEEKQEYQWARAIYESLIDETIGRWEQKAMTLARARILEKLGEPSYAEGLYESLARSPGADKTYRVIAGFHLAKLQEKADPEKAVGTYRDFLRDVVLIPDSLDRAIGIMSSSEGSYNYQNQLRQSTRTDFDFKEAEVEGLLRMGQLLMATNRADEARYRLERAAMKDKGTELGEQVRAELRKIYASEERERPRREKVEREEQLVITHFEKDDASANEY